jgi:hypothetical protein
MPSAMYMKMPLDCPPDRMNIIIIETDIIAIGRYVHTADVSGTVSMRVGGSWRTNSPAGMSGPRRRAGRRNRTTLNAWGS